MSLRLSLRASRVAPSAVREILKVAEQPDVLSFAGGLPAPELFPVEAIARAHAEVLARDGRAALQYSTTEGFLPLRSWICAHLRGQGMDVDEDRTLITAGSQMGIELATRVLLDPGDRVAVESPSYLAALQVFGSHGAECVAVPADEQGMRVDDLERIHRRRPVRMVYLVPNFQNPTGTTLAAERRHALVRFASREGIAVIEDDPYGALRFDGEPAPALAALDASVVVRLGTFSKTLAPGLRVAWASGPKDIIRAMTVARQSIDLHSSTLAQRAVARLLEQFDYEAHVQTIRASYRARRDAMLASLQVHMPAGTRWTRPQGGMFVWVELPDGVSADELLPVALQQKVAFVPGSPFFAERPRHETLRLNFSNRPPELIDVGMARLGRVVTSRLLQPSPDYAAG